MKISIISLLSLFLPTISGHAIFQRVSVNGVDQGLVSGVRSPSTNNPVQNVNSQDIACNTGLITPVTTKVITVPAGAKVGAFYQWLLGGPVNYNDPESFIATSHKGPITVYLAKVSNAATASTSGQSWFKIAQEGLNTGTGKWAVDSLTAGYGWWYFTMPSCIAPGQYLMRVEVLALHSAYSSGGAQFYMACANIQVTGSGTFTTSNTVKFPGAYSASDPGILINIYSGTGAPNNGLKPYAIPGPAPITCGGAAQPTTTKAGATTAKTTTTAAGGGGGGQSPRYGQCGGIGWTGPTSCVSPYTCQKSNDYYSQCL